MNRIYRRIWNAARQCWVVASELSSPRGKPAQTRVLMSALLLTTAGGAFAANETDDLDLASESTPGTLLIQKELIPVMPFAAPNSVASAIAPRGRYDQLAIVMSGNYADARVSGADVLALGSQAQIYGTESTGLGNYAETSGGYATAVGHFARAFGGHGTALGTKAYANGKGATALGHDSQASAGNAVSIGSGARAAYSDSVAIGANSVTHASNTVSVGRSGGGERRITNVRDGRDGTDAVNVNQLGNTNRSIANVESIANSARNTANSAKSNADSALAKASIREGLLNQSSSSSTVRLGGSNSGALLDVRNSNSGNRRITGIADGQVSTSSVEAVNGRQLYATDRLATRADMTAAAAMRQADATIAQLSGASLALGQGAGATSDHSLAIGAFAMATHSGSVALGKDSATTGINQVSIGSKTVQRKIVNMADGLVAKGSTEAVTGNQLFDTHATATSAKTAADAAVAQVKASTLLTAHGTAGNDAMKAQATGGGALASGIYTEANGSSAVAMGNSAKALAGNAIALGAAASSRHANSIALGAFSETTAEDQLAVGNSRTNRFRRIVGVAQGTLSATSDEAVTGAQLFATDRTARDAEVSAKGAVVAADSALSKAKALEGLIQQTTPTGVVRLGAENEGVILNVNNKSGKQRAITGIAAGALSQQSSEAVTGSQLYGTNLRVGALEGLVREDAPAGSVRLGGNNTGSVLDVRNKSNGKRKISGVADGVVSSTSSDAISGSQLSATNEQVAAAQKSASDALSEIAKVQAQSQYVRVGDKGPGVAAQAGPVGVALGDSAEASLLSEGGVALGSFAKARGRNSVALGRASRVDEEAEGGFALGVFSSVEETGGVALGVDSSVQKGAENAAALGAGSIATEERTVSFGNAGLKRRLTNVDRGTADHNATTVGQLNDSLATLGGGAKLDAAGNVTAPTYTVQNTRQHTVGDALTILDNAVLRTTSRMDGVEGQLRSIFQNTPSARTDGFNQLTLAGAQGMVISNVANGLVAAGSRDAVNGGQLHAVQQQLNGRMDGLEQRVDGQGSAPQSRALLAASVEEEAPSPTPPSSSDDKVIADTGNAPKSSPTPQPKADAPDSPTPQVDTAELEKMLARANDYSDGIAREVDARLNKMDKRFNRMAAMSSAQTAMAMNTAGLATYNRLGAGVGYAEGESAMAVGYQRVLNEKGSATFSLNGAFTNSGERSMGVGVGIGW